MPTTATNHHFVLELFLEQDDPTVVESLLARFRVTPDWGPAVECARFESVRRNPGAPALLGGEDVTIEPLWHPTLNDPYVKHVSVGVERPGRPATAVDVGTPYFRPLTKSAAATLVESGTLAEGDKYRYLVTAYARNDEAPAEAPAFAIETVPQELDLGEESLDRLLADSQPYGEHCEQDYPVFIPQTVVDESTALMEAAGAVETGGILIGRMHRDSDGSEIMAEVTAQIHARHTKEELTSLEFTPETWADVDAALALRGGTEMKLGWWHSHPARQWCKDCPVENRRVCKLSGEFFSTQDTALHRTVFPRAYSIGLVVSDSYASGLTYPLFGWKNGTINQRGFHILNS